MTLKEKYSELPDMDTGKDVYETPDFVEDQWMENSSKYEGEETQNEDISNDRLNVCEAKSRFLREQVEAEDVDFSERIRGKNRKSYVTRNFHDYGVIEETIDEKLARLRRELEEVREELNQKKFQENKNENETVNKSFADLSELDYQMAELENKTKKSAIAMLSKRLEELSLPESINNDDKEVVMETNESLNQPLKYTLNYNPSYKEKHLELDLSEFENRLTMLEKSLGIDQIHSYKLQAPILSTLSYLDKKITLLTSNKSYIDSITKKVKNLVAEMEILHEKKTKMDSKTSDLNTTPQEKKIDALYENLEMIESISPILPNLLDRLKALRIIHADAATVTTGLKDCTQRQHIIQDEMLELKETLQKVESTMKESKITIQSNMMEIENMVKKLEQKVDHFEKK
ncbi:hypothetical protein T552_00453 [Pneumocystis carinii B80]|uniref:Dynactin subunit 2 n=1 Tax=Pneumocystis carinii (strain B80) TaxID=1408658 RepID=A0A0W4ZQU0_PNEC8|nr:hypothetical protein T552_00453 [Pneumocystis carinii B80]KTW30741.1 hypothetical protein T552_00453 [Pneumocystis carinii B80]